MIGVNGFTTLGVGWGFRAFKVITAFAIII